MPQVDLETLVTACAGGSCDNKIACETIADDDDQSHHQDEPEIPPDFPPESFWLSKDAEMDWFDRNAFYERKESQKGNSTNLNPHLNPNPSSTSQRFSSTLKSKASIIGLPKPQNSCFVDLKNRKPGNIRLFPKRTASTNKSDPSGVEPSSPKVSCMGRVRSKRDRKRRPKNRRKSVEPEKVKENPDRREKTGFFASFRAIFRSGGRKDKTAREADAVSIESPTTKSVTRTTKYTHDIRDRLPARDIDAPSAESPLRRSVSRKRVDSEITADAAVVGLGGMKRFSSGRRSESWGAVEVA